MAAGDTLRRITINDSWILDSSGAIVGLKNPNANGADLRYDPAGFATYIPKTNDDAGVRAAGLAAAAAGGGMVLLPSATITLSSPLPAANYVRYVGTSPDLVFTSPTVPDSGWTFNGGTVLQGDGTFACFAKNNTALGSPSASYAADGCIGFGVEGVGIQGFTRGFDIGAVNAPGLTFGSIKRVFIRNCSQWGMYLPNFFHTEIDRVWIDCTHANGTASGAYLSASSPSATLMNGNSTHANIYVLQPNFYGRGIVYEAIAGATLNEVHAHRLQCNRFLTPLSSISQSATMANASANITVTDGTKFPVGMPVYFTSSANGFTQNLVYFVLSVAGNIITVGRWRTDAAVTATGNTAITIASYGMPNIELVSNDSGGMPHCRFLHLDMEGTSTCHIYAEKLGNSVVEMSEAGQTKVSDIVFRQTRFVDCLSTQNIITDFDAQSYETNYIGARSTIRQARGAGIWNDTTLGGAAGLNVMGTGTGNGFDLQGVFAPGGNVMKASIGLWQKPVPALTADTTLNAGYSGILPVNKATTITLTLPTLTTTLTGMEFFIPNIGAGSCTVNTDGAQVFNGTAAKTSFTIPSGGCALVRAHASLGWGVILSAAI